MFIAESVSEKEIKIGEYLAKLQARTWLTRALSSSFSSVLARRTKFSQGTVATYARSGGIFNKQFTENFLRNLLCKDLENRLRFDRIMAMKLWPHSFGPPYTIECPHGSRI